MSDITENYAVSGTELTRMQIEQDRLTTALQWIMRHHKQEDGTYLVHNEVEGMLAGEKRFATAVEAVEYMVSIAEGH